MITPSAALLHHRNCILATEEYALDVGGEDAIVVLFGEVPQRRHAVREAGVVDEDVEAPKSEHRDVDHRFDVARQRDIGADELRFAAFSFDRQTSRAALLFMNVGDQHARAFAPNRVRSPRRSPSPLLSRLRPCLRISCDSPTVPSSFDELRTSGISP